MKKMTKDEFVSKVQNNEFTKKDVLAILANLEAAMAMALGSGVAVTIPGVGVFKPAHRDERKGRNPATGEPITIKAKNTVKFAAAKSLLDDLN